MNTAAGAAAARAAGWRWRHVLEAPHRLGFLLASTVLGAAGGWWALVQWGRAGLGPAFAHAVSPSLVHATVMSFGFMPLFFAGFLFTAGPRWLAVPPPTPRALLPALAAQAGGWMLWLAGAGLHPLLAIAGLLLAVGGLVTVTWHFWRMVRASHVPDRLHGTIVGLALLVGCACLASLAVAMALHSDTAAGALVLTGLWGFVVVVFVAVADRMIPFFTAGALPSVEGRHPHGVLALMLGMALFEALAPWIDGAASSATWLALRGGLESVAGTLLLGLAVAWARFKPLRSRLLIMLHAGFAWLGASFLLSGVANLLTAGTGIPVLPLAGLHALTMGCLGTLMLAMVSRVSCGHSGRPNVADNFLWSLFLLLQVAVGLRIAAAAWPAHMQALLTMTAVLWACIMLAWGIRHGIWYGRARNDGRPG